MRMLADGERSLMRSVQVRTVAPEARVTAQDFELRSVEDDGLYLEGVACPFNVWTDVGSYDERFAPTIFDTTLSRNPDRVPLMVGHKVSDIAIGRPVEWLKEDGCLRGIWRFDSRDEARETARMAADGILTGLSVHFVPGRKRSDNTIERDADNGNRPKVTRHNARLLEVSLVSVPAYEGASVTLVRTAGIAELEAAADEADRAARLRAQVLALRTRAARLEVMR